jgi:hypothetical protein
VPEPREETVRSDDARPLLCGFNYCWLISFRYYKVRAPEPQLETIGTRWKGAAVICRSYA